MIESGYDTSFLGDLDVDVDVGSDLEIVLDIDIAIDFDLGLERDFNIDNDIDTVVALNADVDTGSLIRASTSRAESIPILTPT